MAGVDQFIAGLRKLEDAADSYGDPQDKGRNRLVLEFLRYGHYDDWQFDFVLGGIESAWVKHAKAQGIGTDEWLEFSDPVTQQPLGTRHLMAAAEGVVEHETTTAKAGYADAVGWGGDLLTFYIEWRRNKDAYPSGLAFCQDRLARPDIDSTYGYADFIEDADGYHLGRLIRSGLRPSDLVGDYYTGLDASEGQRIATHRFRRFYADRFGGDYATVERLAEGNLTGDEFLQSAGYLLKLEQNGVELPTELPADELNSFLLGFRWALTDRVEAEEGSS